MEDVNEYDSLAQTIQTSEITTNERNARIISCLRNQDPDFTTLTLFYRSEDNDNYVPESGHDLVWLGYFIGSNTQLQDLNIADNIQGVVSITSEQIKLFLEGVNKNKSIKKLILNSFGRHNFQVQVHDLKPLVKDNTNLETLILYNCVLYHQAISLLPLSQTLTTVKFDDIQMTGLTLSRTLDALGMLPRLQTLCLTNANIGVNECRQIAAFLGRDSTNLIDLDLGSNSIDDDAIEVLGPVMSSHTDLHFLDLSENAGISARGQRAISAVLKSPNCSLEGLILEGLNMNDEGAQIFVDALTNNKSLISLGLDNNGISADGWAAFSRLLCDSSSINNTFLSNHALRTLSRHGFVYNMTMTQNEDLATLLMTDVYNMTRNEDLATLLCINGLSDSRHQAAVLKILRSHPDINMQPLFEWDFKLMPYVVDWLVEAGDHTSRFSARISSMKIRRDNDASIETVNLRTRLEALAQQCQQDLPKRKLTALYQFIKGIPELYIESRLLAVLHRTRTTRNRLQHELEENDLQEQECLRALKSRRLNSE